MHDLSKRHPGRSAPAPERLRLRRRKLYSTLALVCIAGIIGGQLLSHHLARAHQLAIQRNSECESALALCDKIDSSTTTIDACTIGVTRSENLKGDLARVLAADSVIDKALGSLRAKLVEIMPAEKTRAWDQALSSITNAIDRVTEQSRAIFASIQTDGAVHLESRFLLLGGDYNLAQERLDGIRSQIKAYQAALLDAQNQRFLLLERMTEWFGLGVALMIAGAFWSAWRLGDSLWSSEAARLEEAGRFRALIENISDVISICDERGTTQYVSPSVEPILGYRPEELIGRNVFEHVHPDDAVVFRKGFHEAIQQSGRSNSLKYRFRHRDGTWRTLEAVGQNLLEEPGVRGMVLYFHDVTVRDQVQEALIESEARYRLLFNHTVDGVMLADEESRIISANPALCRLLGYTQEEILKLSVLDTYATEGLTEFEERRKLPSGESKQFQRRVRRKDGSFFEAEVNLIHIKGCLQSVVRDVTERVRARQALEASETKYRSLVEHSQDGIVTVDLDYRIVYANECAAQILGYPRIEMLGMDVRKTYPPGHHQANLKHYQTLPTGEAVEYQREALRRDGSICVIDVTLFRLSESMFQVTYRDITERVRAEETTRLQTAALEAAANAIMIVDCRGTIAWVNPAFTVLTGYAASEAIGENPRILKSGQQGRAFYERMWRTVCSGEAWSGQLTNRRKDGRVYREQMTITPVTNRSGAITHYVAIKTDVTESHKIQQELRESQERLDALVGAAQDAMIMFDSHGRISLWNQAATRIFGYEAQEASGQNVYPLILASRCQTDLEQKFAALCHDDKGMAIGQVLELTGVRKNGREFPVEISLASVQLDGVWHAVGIFRDISRRKLAEVERVALELQLRHGQKMEAIGQLSAGIAHEINTPTQYIGDNVRFVQEAVQAVNPVLAQYRRLIEAGRNGAITEQMISEAEATMAEADLGYMMAEVPKAIQESLEGINRVSKIVQAMKEFSHPGSKDKTMVDLNAAIESTLTVCRSEWKYVAELETDYDTDLPLVPCLVGEFNQVTLNLIVNAAHAIADVVVDGKNTKGRIRVSTRHVGDWAEVRIGDTGTGIPEAIRSKVFDPFFTTKPVGKGSGQGLAIAHSVIVDKHGGTIHFETEVGKGATFIIRLPLGASVADEAESHHETANSLC
ncbi:MAG TPA: PAS domain S-box protein [Verrucomicrobiae bacterium]|nr:PAS domain S-box protein [Verrucomicrobiae bacterium]